MASHLVSQLRETTPILPARPHRFAGFVVLKAPDVPSVLIELGFLSNPADEKRLLAADHRRRVAAGIALAVDRYFGRIEAARAPG
jgi:N-acetylmuramoyl-L-alanine amidase